MDFAAKGIRDALKDASKEERNKAVVAMTVLGSVQLSVVLLGILVFDASALVTTLLVVATSLLALVSFFFLAD